MSDPQLNFRFDHDGPPIRLLPGGRLRNGQKLRVSFFHGMSIHDGQVTVCMSEPKLHEVWQRQTELIQQHLTPRRWLLSMDEIRAGGSCEACRSRQLSMAEILRDWRWVRLGFMNFQVSELARVMLLTYVASYAVRRAEELRSDFKGFGKPVVLLVVAAVLLVAEPDFGAATVLVATGLAVLFIAGARITHLAVPIVLGVASLAMLAVTSSYRLRRLTAFRNPWDDPFDSGFQWCSP